MPGSAVLIEDGLNSRREFWEWRAISHYAHMNSIVEEVVVAAQERDEHILDGRIHTSEVNLEGFRGSYSMEIG